MTYLTVPISADNIEELKVQATKALSLGAEMLELRSDYLVGLDLEMFKEAFEFLKTLELPIIVTCRDAREGGQNNLEESLRLQILTEAIKLGADYVDCEYINYKRHEFSTEIEAALEENGFTKLILSIHNFESPFTDLRMVYESIVSICSHAVVKIVYKANHINDCFECFDLYRENDSKLVVLCMSQAGLITRVLAKKFGAEFTFASLDDDCQTASGQISISTMKDLYRYDLIDKDTQLYGIIAAPVGHSMSPAIHNACFKKAGMNKLYLPILLEGDSLEFNEFMDMLRDRPWLGFKGFSVSLPHKENTLDYLKNKGQELESLALEIGSINTITISEASNASGFNTDYKGAMDAIAAAVGGSVDWFRGKNAAVIGAGGVARAIIAGLRDRGCHVTIYNRTIARCEKLAREFGAKAAPLEKIGSDDWNPDLIVNCTSVGMSPNVGDSVVSIENITSDMVVFDTVYNPVETKLLGNAKAVGAKTVSGVDMFVAQAMEQFIHFTGEKGDAEIMRKTVFDWL